MAGPQHHKYGFFELHVEREIEAWRALGPNGQEIVAYIEALKGLDVATRTAAWDATRTAAAWDAARNAAAWDAARNAAAWYAAWYAAAWDAARNAAAWYAAWYAVRDVARNASRYSVIYAARYAALALCVRDLISDKHFATLYAPWEPVIPADSLGPWETLKGRVIA